jgi:hypothetical protein
MAEGSEFKLRVPLSKLSDDSIILEFVTVIRVAAMARKLQCRAWRPRVEGVPWRSRKKWSARSRNPTPKEALHRWLC